MSLGSVATFVTGGLWSWLSPEGTAAWWSLWLRLGVKGRMEEAVLSIPRIDGDSSGGRSYLHRSNALHPCGSPGTPCML